MDSCLCRSHRYGAGTGAGSWGQSENLQRGPNCPALVWRAHDDSSRQRGTACPLLYRYRLTHTYCLLALLPPTYPFVGAPILQLHFQVQWRAPPPASSSLTRARRMDGFCNQNADQLGSLAGLSFPAVYVGVVEYASAFPYTYSTHRFPDERTPIEATPPSATSAELGLGLGLGLGLVHTPPHTLLSFSPPSFHTISLSLAFTSA